MAWGMKGIGGLPLSILSAFYKQTMLEVLQQAHAILSAFYKQTMLEVLQQAHAISILRQVVVVGEGFNRLGILIGGPPLLLFDMLDLRGSETLMCPMWFAGSFVFLEVLPSILFLVFLPF
jgi:hypothetical protein